mgnify:CR=1 FL=1
MDSERLKKGGSILTKDYFEKQLEKVREIRLSERRFYQKVTDIYATSIDYDPTAAATQRFFAAVQNKLHYAVHQHTAAELIYERANADKENINVSDDVRREIDEFISDYYDRYSGIYLKSKIFLEVIK